MCVCVCFFNVPTYKGTCSLLYRLMKPQLFSTLFFFLDEQEQNDHGIMRG